MQAHTVSSFVSSIVASLAPAALRPVQAGDSLESGWYDSSFDLAQGLDVVEQDDDALYQLWALARRH